MRKLNYVLISLLILIVLLGTVYFVVFYEAGEKIPIPLAEEDPIVKAFLANDELMNHIGGLMDRCLVEQNIDYLCMAIYEDKEDDSFCDEMNYYNEVMDCQSTYYLYKFYLTNNSEMCKKITIPKFKGLCEEFSKNNFRFCEEIVNEDERLWCSALFKKEVSLCNRIKSQNLRRSCEDKTNFLNAFDKKDIKRCEKIKEDTEKDICKVAISKDSSFCKIEGTPVCYDFDYFNNAYLQIYDIEQKVLKKLVTHVIEET